MHERRVPAESQRFPVGVRRADGCTRRGVAEGLPARRASARRPRSTHSVETSTPAAARRTDSVETSAPAAARRTDSVEDERTRRRAADRLRRDERRRREVADAPGQSRASAATTPASAIGHERVHRVRAGRPPRPEGRAGACGGHASPSATPPRAIERVGLALVAQRKDGGMPFGERLSHLSFAKIARCLRYRG